MAKLLQLKRLHRITLVLVMFYCLLGARLVETHVFRHPVLNAMEKEKSLRVASFRPKRGEIRDVNGRVLASNVDVKTINADPTYVGGYRDTIAALLAYHLGGPASEWAEKIALKQIMDDGVPREVDGKPVYDAHVYLKENVPVDVWEALQKDLQSIRGSAPDDQLKHEERTEVSMARRAVYADDAQRRSYPLGETASHLIGFLQKDQKQTLFGRVDDYRGVYGIEYYFDKPLAGSWGYRLDRWYQRSRRHAALREGDVPALDGMNVHLTVDLRIQQFVEEQIKMIVEQYAPDSVSVIVVRPKTGDVLAMANAPTFDPNDSRTRTNDRIVNRAIADSLDPGSVFKIVAVSGALNERVVNLQSTFFCENGLWLYNRRTLKDDNHEFGNLTVEEIIEHSSNIGTAKISLALGERPFMDYVERFGFGRKTGIALNGEQRGLVIPPEKWDGITQTRMAIGQSIGVTPLQMTMAYAAIANGGRLMRPRIVDRIENANGKVRTYPPQFQRQVVRPEIAGQMTQALKKVVTDGTGRHAELKDYTVAGKTGTAQQMGLVNGSASMDAGKYAALFIGFFPADDPEVCISVVINNPDRSKGYYGGSTAAPHWQKIASRTAQFLNVPPDKMTAAQSLQMADNRNH